jgi:hypothetical protein
MYTRFLSANMVKSSVNGGGILKVSSRKYQVSRFFDFRINRGLAVVLIFEVPESIKS